MRVKGWDEAGPLERTVTRGLVVLGPLTVFAVFLLVQGVNPIQTYSTMFRAAFGDWYGLGEVVVKTAPLILTALATAVPARVALVNVGGEGQLAAGALLTTWAAVNWFSGWPGYAGLPMLFAAGALGGAVWAGVAAILKVRFTMNETITTLLLNYVAFYAVGHFVHGPLKDPASFNWPFSPPLPDSLRLPVLPGTRIHAGIVLAAAAAAAVWWVTARTRLGFRMRVVGGNGTAARHAGISVNRMRFWVLVVAGALAGLAAAVEVAGIEGRLRPTTGVNDGYLGFLAAWMVRNHPLGLVGSSFLLGALTVAGNSMEISSGLPSSSVNILTALVLMGILAYGKRGERE